MASTFTTFGLRVWAAAIGTVLLGSQVIWQFLGHEPSYLLLAAGISVFAGTPLLAFGDKRGK